MFKTNHLHHEFKMIQVVKMEKAMESDAGY